jgi:uncharacterized protein YcfL
MRHLLLIIIPAIILCACNTTRNYSSQQQQDASYDRTMAALSIWADIDAKNRTDQQNLTESLVAAGNAMKDKQRKQLCVQNVIRSRPLDPNPPIDQCF